MSHQTSHLDLQHFKSSDTQKAFQTFINLLSSCAGPCGKIHIVRNICGGHVTCTSHCYRLLSSLSVSRLELKLIVSSVKAHLNQTLDCGLFMGCICLHTILSSVESGVCPRSFVPLYELFLQILIQHLNTPECSICVKADYSELTVLIAYVKSILSSKALLNFTTAEKDHVCTLIVKAFVESLPNRVSSSSPVCFSDRVHIVCQQGRSIKDSKLMKGCLFLEYPELPVLKGPIELNVKRVFCHVENMRQNPPDLNKCVKVALVTCSMSGDVEEVVDTAFIGMQNQFDVLKNALLDTMKDFVKKLESHEVGLILCQRVIHPEVKTQLRSTGILFIDRLGSCIIPYLQDLTGSQPILSLTTIHGLPEMLGKIDSIDHVVEHDKGFLCLHQMNSCVVTLRLCNPWEENLSEMESCVKTSLHGLKSLTEDPRLLAGGGCWQVYSSFFLGNLVLQQMSSIALNGGCTEAHVLYALKSFRSSLHHWVRHLADEMEDVLVDPHSYHCWRVQKGDLCEVPELKYVSCCCGLKFANVNILPSFIVLSKHEHMNAGAVVEKKTNSEVQDYKIHSNTVLDNIIAATQALHKGVVLANLVLSVGRNVVDKNFL